MDDTEILINKNTLGQFVQEQQNAQKEKESLLTRISQLHKESSSNFIPICTNILNEICALRQQNDKALVNAWQESFSFMQTLYKWIETDRKSHKEDGHNFNVFSLLDLCGISIGETSHSRLLKFLLEPNELHGQGNLFLCLFLQRLDIKIAKHMDEEHWNIVAEQGRIDLLLVRNHPLSVVVIENKSNWAIDQPNQLYRYWHNAIYSRTKHSEVAFYENRKEQFRIVYLTPNEYKIPTFQTLERPENWPTDLPKQMPMKPDIRTFNGFICQWIEDCIQALPSGNHALREFLRQYQMTCKKL